jgi:galactoside O-acetyltransferase
LGIIILSFLNDEELAAMKFGYLGENVKISSKASFYGVSRISIGSNSRIDDFCVLSAGVGGIQIGRNVHIAVMCTLIGDSKIELKDFCGLSSRVSIYSSTDDYSGNSMTNPTVPITFKHVKNRDVILNRHVIIGSGSVILPGSNIGEGAAIGALSLVTKSIGAYEIYAGTPLKKIKSRSRKLLSLEKDYISSSK